MWSFIVSNRFTLYPDRAHNVKPLKHWLFPHNFSHSPKVTLCLVFYTAVSQIFCQCSHQLCNLGRTGCLYLCLPYSERPLHKKQAWRFAGPTPELLPPIPVRRILPESSLQENHLLLPCQGSCRAVTFQLLVSQSYDPEPLCRINLKFTDKTRWYCLETKKQQQQQKQY